MSVTDLHSNTELENQSHGDHGHEHKENFWTKYIFSMDHKMIAKQYMFTAMFWAIMGGLLSVIFRLQLGFPDMNLEFLRPFLGKWVSEAGQLDPNFTWLWLPCMELS